MKSRLWLMVALMAVVSLNGCGGDANGEAESPAEQTEVMRVPVETQRVQLDSIAASYAGTAILEAEREATVVAKTSGVLLELLVEEGDIVEQGDVMARLEQAQQQLALEQAQAELRRLESDFQRMQKMYQRQLVSADQFEQTRYAFEAQQAAFEMARLQLDYTTIEAPISGIVTRRLVKEGNLIEQYQPLFQIHDFEPLHAILHIPEQQLGLLEPGLDVVLESAAFPGRTFRGAVLRVSPVVDRETATFQVTLQLPNSERALKPGMFVNANIVYEVHENVPVIPRVALLNEDGAMKVFVVNDGVAHERNVTVGIGSNGEVEVLEGLESGQQIVTMGQAGLRDQTQVDVIGGAAETQSGQPDA